VRLEASVNLVRVSRQERAQRVGATDLCAIGVELGAELGQHRSEIHLVLRPDHVADVAIASRPFPVDVNAVEDAEAGARSALRLTTEHWQITLDEQIKTACHEGLPVGRQRSVGEKLRPGPAAQREDHLEVRKLLLELLELVEVAGKAL